jgi:hypothetical protein
MKTHEAAQLLMQLAKILRRAPNVELSNFELNNFNRLFTEQSNSDEVVIGLSTLVELSQVDKNQWLSLIREYQFPIAVRPRDASRDILGKLLRYLDENPEARKKLKENVKKKTSHASPELMNALEILLKE